MAIAKRSSMSGNPASTYIEVLVPPFNVHHPRLLAALDRNRDLVFSGVLFPGRGRRIVAYWWTSFSLPLRSAHFTFGVRVELFRTDILGTWDDDIVITLGAYKI